MTSTLLLVRVAHIELEFRTSFFVAIQIEIDLHFASGIRLDDPHWGKDGQGRAPVLAVFPDPNPPKPLGSFAPHGAENSQNLLLGI